MAFKSAETRLVEDGLLTAEQIKTAISIKGKGSLGPALIRLGFVSRRDYVRAKAHQVGFEFVDLGSYAIDTEAVRRLPLPVARRCQAVPIAETEISMHGWTEPGLLVAVADPAQSDVHLRLAAGCRIRRVVALPEEINVALEKFGHMMPQEGDCPECERAR